MSIQFGDAYSTATKKNAKAIDVRNLPGPERQRGLWSFLTWSFFLANFLTGTDIFGQAAHAAAMVGGDHDNLHSGNDASSSGISHPEMQHMSLESLASDPTAHADQANAAMNSFSGATASLPDFSAMHFGASTAQPNLESSIAGQVTFASESGAHSDTINNYFYSSDSHDSTNSATNNYYDNTGSDGNHDVVSTVVDTVIHPVTDAISPLVGVVDTTLQTASNVLGNLGDTLGTVTDDVGHILGGATTAVSDIAHSALNTVASTLGDVVPTAISAVDTLATTVTHTVDDIGGSFVHAVADIGSDVMSSTSPIVTLLDHDGATNSLLPSVSHDVLTAGHDLVASGTDIVGSALNGLGLSSSGSLAFAAETPDVMLAHDIGSGATGYSQFNLALSDSSADAGATGSASTDTGGITTIITSAIGIGSHASHSDTDSVDHSSDQQSVHLPVLDDLQSHLHGLLG
ncbi:hypothetical protein [Hyphomicrobium sp.]|uniref:hypothetical protein n=1 Tax=Hyphomicrobium sp. TaxID=82 RepID=UPI002C67B36D|nr:hypothetical protein [Hyphomicrobium sp.]HVZ03942.1 hypothetical protein [Hyphomicrobium sp.]